MACCGRGAGARVEYEVKLANGETQKVDSIMAAKRLIALGGGGTYKAVTKTK